MFEPVTNPGTPELRKFGFILGSLLIGVWGLLIPMLIMGRGPLRWALIAGTISIVWAAVAPASMWQLYRVWMMIGGVLGWINTRIILSIFFYLIMTPLAIAFRLMGKDPMRRRLDPTATTYRIPSQQADPKHMEKPY